MFSRLLTDLYHRFILSYRTTLIGVGLVALDVVVQTLQGSNNQIAHAIAVVLGVVLALLKEKGKVPTPDPASSPA